MIVKSKLIMLHYAQAPSAFSSCFEKKKGGGGDKREKKEDDIESGDRFG